MADLSLTMTMLNDFMNIARRQSHPEMQKSQSEILKSFLRMIVLGKNRGGADLCESGSILTYKPDGMLHLFNDDEFLFKENLLDREKFKKTVFALHEGLGPLAFSSNRIQYSADVSKDPRFLNLGEPIKSMLCAPIVLPSRARQFGVASFHNGQDAPPFSEATKTAMEVAVNTLCFALDLAGRTPSDNIFIVHGHDTAALYCLKSLLLERHVKPIVLGEQSATGAEMLEHLERLLADCYAGFVLLTPDDEGRLRKLDNPKPHMPRARQNVIFEGGWLSALFRRQQRICFLHTGNVELPSDILGVRYLDFDPEDPDIIRIENVLTTWGVNWKRPDAR
jgi:predicted nucleotide-binding protein